MPRYDLTEQAQRDLEAITDYTLERWGQRQAENYLDGFEVVAQNLAEHPHLGVKRSTFFEGLISFPYARHILYYVEQPHGITIIRVLHQRMDPERHLATEGRG